MPRAKAKNRDPGLDEQVIVIQPPGTPPTTPGDSPMGGKVTVELSNGGTHLAVNYEGRQVSASLNANGTVSGTWS